MKYVSLILILVVFFSTMLVGGLFDYPVPKSILSVPTHNPVQVYNETYNKNNSLQIANLRVFPEATVACTPTDKIAVDFLLDTSGSMERFDREAKLKRALLGVSSFIQSDTIIGIQQFSGDTTKEVIKISPFGSVAANNNGKSYDELINTMKIGGGTPMRQGFKITRDTLRIAINNPVYKTFKWYLILIADGGPNKGEDPRQAARNETVSYVDQIKQMDVTIFTIGIQLDDPDNKGGTYQDRQNLMREIATGGNYFYEVKDSEVNALESVFDRIANEVCLKN